MLVTGFDTSNGGASLLEFFKIYLSASLLEHLIAIPAYSVKVAAFSFRTLSKEDVLFSGDVAT